MLTMLIKQGCAGIIGMFTCKQNASSALIKQQTI